MSTDNKFNQINSTNEPGNNSKYRTVRYIHQKIGLIAYKRLENKLDKAYWYTNTDKSHLQYWAQDLHTVISKTTDDRCDTTIYDRFTKINIESFNGNTKHIQKSETTVYTDGAKQN